MIVDYDIHSRRIYPEYCEKNIIDDQQIKPINNNSNSNLVLNESSKSRVTFKDETSWIKYKNEVNYDQIPSEPSWMSLVKRRRWKSTVRGRFPANNNERENFDNRTTSPVIGSQFRAGIHKKAILNNPLDELQSKLAIRRQLIESNYDSNDSNNDSNSYYNSTLNNSFNIPLWKQELNMAFSENDSLERKTFNDSTDYTFKIFREKFSLNLKPEEYSKMMAMKKYRSSYLKWRFSSDPPFEESNTNKKHSWNLSNDIFFEEKLNDLFNEIKNESNNNIITSTPSKISSNKFYSSYRNNMRYDNKNENIKENKNIKKEILEEENSLNKKIDNIQLESLKYCDKDVKINSKILHIKKTNLEKLSLYPLKQTDFQSRVRQNLLDEAIINNVISRDTEIKVQEWVKSLPHLSINFDDNNKVNQNDLNNIYSYPDELIKQVESLNVNK